MRDTKGVNDVDSWRELSEISKHREALTTRETEFMESLQQQLLQGRYLTDRQRLYMRRIREDRLP